MTSSVEMISKVSLAGESMVGKTSLIRRFVTDQFDDKYLMTIGAKVSKKSITIPDTQIGDVRMNLMIWDIVGLSGYHSRLHSAHFKGAKGAILVCDSTRVETFEVLGEWAESIISVAGRIPMLFLVNKSDLESKLNSEELRKLADRFGTKWLPTSAKTGMNVNEAFQLIGRKIIEDSAAPQ